MEAAYVWMFATFATAFVLGVATKSKWVSIGLPLLIPLAATLAPMIGKGRVHGEDILFASPFLLVIAVYYSIISVLGSRAGGWFRRTFLSAPKSSNDTQ